MKEEKTNAMRIMEREGVAFEALRYECTEFMDGVHIAGMIGWPEEQVFKTLVALGASRSPLVFVIPVAEELDLKAAARAAGEKSVQMLPLARLTEVTGYIRGGCSPVGMKKKFPTYIHETAIVFDEIYVSAGQRGLQMKVNPEQLAEYVEAPFADLTKG